MTPTCLRFPSLSRWSWRFLLCGSDLAWIPRQARLGRFGVVLAGGAVMGLAISGMHYVGMTAARFVGAPLYSAGFSPADGTGLAPIISAIVVAVTFVVFAANMALRYRDLAVALQANIARRKMSERALRDSEAQFRTLIDNIPGVTYRSSIADGLRTVFVSEGAKSVTGYPADEFVRLTNRRRIFDLILPEDMPGVEERVNAAIANGTAAAHEFRLRHRDGGTRWVWVMADQYAIRMASRAGSMVSFSTLPTDDKWKRHCATRRNGPNRRWRAEWHS